MDVLSPDVLSLRKICSSVVLSLDVSGHGHFFTGRLVTGIFVAADVLSPDDLSGKKVLTMQLDNPISVVQAGRGQDRLLAARLRVYRRVMWRAIGQASQEYPRKIWHISVVNSALFETV
jgi:hypothetical protein